MDKADKVTIRLTPEEAAALDELVESGTHRTRSEAIRASIDRMLSARVEEMNMVHVKLPDLMVQKLELLVDAEFFISKEIGVQELVREGLRKIDLREVQASNEHVSEAYAEKSVKDIIEDQYSSMIKE